MSRASVEISLSAITQNFKSIKRRTTADVLAVVKADAYGHGLIPVSKALEEAGADWFGTALLEEAINLRKAGILKPIISWLTPLGEDFKSAIDLDIDLGIPSIDLLDEVIKAASLTGKAARIHLEIDTGMSRGGALSEWDQLIKSVLAGVNLKQLKVIGIWSHFARADEPDELMNQEQLSLFEQRVNQAKAAGIDAQFIHIANSAALFTNKSAHKNIIRSGIALFGLSPDVKTIGDSSSLSLKPAMKLKAKLNLVKEVKAGSSVGYGGTAVLKSDTKLGVVALGYADGIPRSTNNLAGVFVDKKRAPIIGRVSMDQFVVDLGITSTAKAGDEVIVFGDGSNGEYTVDEWAKAANTINYEIITRIGPRVPRIYPRE
ncbi:alanine racemase [Candidatus Nanopelagicus abundans]|uniref:Alanine racemase n=1 Tax=Candidatus Nanopelagicus abundans TaxID=1884916 RepID=A0A249L2Z2_9ACTN|nr:alanine racemase [Candidatus Nanopelagicus abundans]ASY23460.1 alanine racemase [Candidatus Nanopelagicus abundans]